MGCSSLKAILRKVLTSYGFDIVRREDTYDRQKEDFRKEITETIFADGARAYLYTISQDLQLYEGRYLNGNCPAQEISI